MSIRDRVNFVPHVRGVWNDQKLLETGVTNLVHESKKPDEQWIVETTRRIGDWRSKSRSAYMRWALAINGLRLAEQTYTDWPTEKRFEIKSIRVRRGTPDVSVIAAWNGADAARNHADTADMIAAYGVCDLFGSLEEIVFAAYRIYLDHHPVKLLGGAEFKELRTLYYRSKRDEAAAREWPVRWKDRAESWQRKRAYDGLASVFLAYVQHAGLRQPYGYKHSTPATWAETIGGIAELRNLVTHGMSVVSPNLAAFSAKPHNAGFDFAEGQPLVVRNLHLMGVECFVDQLLTALNVALIELAVGPEKIRKIMPRPPS